MQLFYSMLHLRSELQDISFLEFLGIVLFHLHNASFRQATYCCVEKKDFVVSMHVFAQFFIQASVECVSLHIIYNLDYRFKHFLQRYRESYWREHIGESCSGCPLLEVLASSLSTGILISISA